MVQMAERISDLLDPSLRSIILSVYSRSDIIPSEQIELPLFSHEDNAIPVTIKWKTESEREGP